jgi:murein DD-endopeptidase MepM/ murein hydrolase activator NlpD
MHLATLLTPVLLGLALQSVARDAAAEATAKTVTRDMLEGRYDAVASTFNTRMKAAVSTSQLQSLVDPIKRERGPLVSLEVTERHTDRGAMAFVLSAGWTRGNRSRIDIAIDGEGRVSGLYIHDEGPLADLPPARTSLRPPFRGTWTAHNAARTPWNHHFNNVQQRFAVDWVQVEGGRTYRTDGKTNADYYAYGQDALAPAAGTVAIVVDGVPENPRPGERDPYHVCGNEVVIDLGNGEYALLCHLIPGSIPIRPGDKVASGQRVGRIGNSGNSTEPHLHFQVNTSPRLIAAQSMPAPFAHVLVDGKPRDGYEPTEGARVAPIENGRQP